MRSLNFVSIKLTLGLVLGILMGFYFELGPMLPFIGLLVVLTVLYFTKNTRPKDGISLFEIGVIFGMMLLGSLVLGLSLKPPHHYTKFEINGKKVWHLKIRDKLKPNPYSQNYVVEVISVDNRKSSGKLLLNTLLDSTAQDFLRRLPLVYQPQLPGY